MSDDARIRELAELIRKKCTQQPTQVPGGQLPGSTAAAQMSHSDEVRKRLKEAVFRLQEDVRDRSIEGIKKRLQFMAQKNGVTFTDMPTAHGVNVFLSSDAFYIEVDVEENGHVTRVKLVHHDIQQLESELLTSLVQQQEFHEFEAHVKALMEMYSHVSGQKDKATIFRVMSATESVLMKLNEKRPNPCISEAAMLNALGHITPRKAGLPMKLTFFIRPEEVLKRRELLQPGGVDIPDSVGVSAKVLVERSALMSRLPVDPNLYNFKHGQLVPLMLTQQNSVLIPLTMVLALSEDIPVCGAMMAKLQQTVYGADQTLPPLVGPHINQLISREHYKDKSWTPPKVEHTVHLPGQVHRYVIMDGLADSCPAQYRGVLLPNRKVPFTHPSHVLAILRLLRQQLVYNRLLVSCLQRRPDVGTRSNAPSVYTEGESEPSSEEEFELTVVTQPAENVSISTDLQTNREQSLKLTIECSFVSDLKALPQPEVYVTVGEGGQREHCPTLSAILTKCLSIPVMLHAAFSSPSILGASACAALQQHHQALALFHQEVVQPFQPTPRPNLAIPPAVAATAASSATLAAGVKRKWAE